MLTDRRDYLLRLIQQAGAAAARLRELLTGEAASTGGVAREADEAIAALLGGGARAQLLERVDAETAVRLLGDAGRLQAWVDLLRVQADALSRDSPADGERVRTRAAALESAGSRLSDSLGA